VNLQEKKFIVSILMFIFFIIGGFLRNLYLTYEIEWLRGLPQIFLALTFSVPLFFYKNRKTPSSRLIALLQLAFISIYLLFVAGLLFLGIIAYLDPNYKP